MNLGSLGVDHPPIDDTFDWFGSTVRVHPDLTDAVLLDFAEAAEKVQSTSAEDGGQGKAAMRMVREFLRDVVHPDDFDGFWKVGRKNRQTIDDFTNVAMRIIESRTEEETERPTQRPGDSSTGPEPTSLKSGDVSYLRAMRHLEGRPDLQLMVVEASQVG